MAKKDEELELVTIRLYKGDRARMQGFYPEMGYNLAIRKLVNKHLKALDERVSKKISEDN